MPRISPPSQATSLSLAATISAEVIGWRNQGYHPFPSETTRQLLALRFGGLEQEVMETMLDGSPEVLAWCKLQRKHGLFIAYREDSGLLRKYEVDFILRTAESCFLLETKSDKDMEHPNVGLKARAAKHWCASIGGIAPPGLDQPKVWEYLLLPENLYKANQGASFTALLPLMRQETNRLLAAEAGRLFG